MGVTHKTCSRRDSLLSDGRTHPHSHAVLPPRPRPLIGHQPRHLRTPRPLPPTQPCSSPASSSPSHWSSASPSAHPKAAPRTLTIPPTHVFSPVIKLLILQRLELLWVWELVSCPTKS